MGRSRCGFLVSCAAVETASKPMYAKNTMVAPCRIPEMPKRPNVPSLAGTNGTQFSWRTNGAAAAMNISTTATFTSTMMPLKRADSLMPTTRIAVTASTMKTAGRLMMAPGGLQVRGGGFVPDERRHASRPREKFVARHVLDERAHVARPAHADRGRADQVLEDEVPADDPRDELAHGGVGVGVGATGDRDHGGHFGVAQAREGRRDGGDGERKGDGGPGVGRGGAAR